MYSFHHSSKMMALFVVLGALASCAMAEESKPMMMGQCDPAKRAACAQKMNMGEDMTCDMMKNMPLEKKKMMHDCMRNMGMMDGMQTNTPATGGYRHHSNMAP